MESNTPHNMKLWYTSLDKIPESYNWDTPFKNEKGDITVTRGDFSGDICVSLKFNPELDPFGGHDQAMFFRVVDNSGKAKVMRENLILHNLNTIINYYIGELTS